MCWISSRRWRGDKNRPKDLTGFRNLSGLLLNRGAMHNPSPLIPGIYYHIFNRGNNRQNLFIEARNYLYFLRCYSKHIEPVADTFCYCLLPNHFHLFVRIKETALNASQSFSNFFNAYAKAVNHTYQRTGSMFQRPFGRIPVTNDAYFLMLLAYIHHNPQKHGLMEDFRQWTYSSYPALVSNKSTHLQREQVLDWFQGVDEFIKFHEVKVNEEKIAALLLEEQQT
jgi:putative transposase